MKKWEYKVDVLLGPSTDDSERLLNSLGAEGWELIDISGGWAILKRPIDV